MNKVTVDAGRVPLSTEMVKLFGDPASREDIQVRLFLVDVGHLRVIADLALHGTLGFDLNAIDALTLATREDRERLAALRMRLFSTSIKPVKRLVIPAEVFDACEEETDRRHVWIDFSSGFIDVYTATYRERRLAMSSDKLFVKPEQE
ncbi:MAG: hypothetical protein ABI833_12230 [Acidobacteriota bacterium]